MTVVYQLSEFAGTQQHVSPGFGRLAIMCTISRHACCVPLKRGHVKYCGTPRRTTMASFANEIKPLFRPKDIASMKFLFDLSDYESVKANAEAIYSKLSEGEMPCDGAWPGDKVALFQQWMSEGMPQ
jgi:hypothetical protein